MAAYDASLRVWRGDATGGELKDYTVEVNDGEVVLDIIHRLQATQAGDLAVRWNCKAGKCGSCSAEINGKPRLLCMTRMSTFDPTETVTVSPAASCPHGARRTAACNRAPTPSAAVEPAAQQPNSPLANSSGRTGRL